MGHFEKRHVTSFKTRNEPKMKVFDFGAFQNKMQIAPREKYIFCMLFGAFHGTPRTEIIPMSHGEGPLPILTFDRESKI